MNQEKAQGDINGATIYFCPKRLWGQYALRKATIEVANQKVTTKINGYSKLKLNAGEANILCYGNYLGKCGKSQETFYFQDGCNYLVDYRSPLLIFMAGKIQIHSTDDNIETELISKVKKRKITNGSERIFSC